MEELEQKAKEFFTEDKWWMRIWGDGTYFDLWHINHFLAGVLFGYVVYYTKINMWIGLALSFFLMIVWEIYEVKHQIQETSFNRATDLALGVIGFFAFYYVSMAIGEPAAFALFLVSLTLWFILEVWGFIAYLKKQHVNKNLP